jgi:hypothetical protein
MHGCKGRNKVVMVVMNSLSLPKCNGVYILLVWGPRTDLSPIPASCDSPTVWWRLHKPSRR